MPPQPQRCCTTKEWRESEERAKFVICRGRGKSPNWPTCNTIGDKRDPVLRSFGAPKRCDNHSGLLVGWTDKKPRASLAFSLVRESLLLPLSTPRICWSLSAFENEDSRAVYAPRVQAVNAHAHAILEWRHIHAQTSKWRPNGGNGHAVDSAPPGGSAARACAPREPPAGG